ncbi:hypothetical protein [Nocardia sp. AG03]|uniref:hypothetical protein n=1 Tax=Nocardia sp. AG03 TaxID=3025312 RepID=UPI00241895D6|nr:hypothetical protein [Nocardia sp. AG03]
MSIQIAEALPRRRAPLHRPLLYFAAVNAVLAVVAGIGMLVDDRVITGAAAWFKPGKFALSFVLYSVALAWLISLRPKPSRLTNAMATVIVVAGTVEQLIIFGQVVRGRRSHYNMTTTLDGILWITMGVTILVLFVATMVVAVQLWRTRVGDAAITWSIRLGLAVTLAGLALGNLMPGRESGVDGIVGAHTVGAPTALRACR